jgi:hypothetical protein
VATVNTPPFAMLIQERRAELHLSYVALASEAIDPKTGVSITYSWIHRLERGHPVIPPQLPQLRALATGLRLPLARLQEAAAAQFFGMQAGDGSLAESDDLIERVQRLTQEQRDALTGFLDAFG